MTENIKQFQELTAEQIERQDYVDNEIHSMMCELSGNDDLEWNIEPIAEIREIIYEYLEKEGVMSEMDFYPYMERD